MKHIVLIGGGGHCLSCIETIEATGSFLIQGVLDRDMDIGSTILGHPVIGRDNKIEELIAGEVSFCIAVGQTVSGISVREKIYGSVVASGGELPVIVSPYSVVSRHAVIGEGVIAMAGTYVNAAAQIGANTILNSMALVEHGSLIGTHCHISTGARINGDCYIGDRCFIGSGAIIKNGVSIGDNITVGMGSVVVKNLQKPGVYFGIPARRISS